MFTIIGRQCRALGRRAALVVTATSALLMATSIHAGAVSVGASVSFQINANPDYSACAVVSFNGYSGARGTFTLTSAGAEQGALTAFQPILATATDSVQSDAGSAQFCVQGGFVAQAGQVTFVLDWQTPSGVPGEFVYTCQTVEMFFCNGPSGVSNLASV